MGSSLFLPFLTKLEQWQMQTVHGIGNAFICEEIVSGYFFGGYFRQNWNNGGLQVFVRLDMPSIREEIIPGHIGEIYQRIQSRCLKNAKKFVP